MSPLKHNSHNCSTLLDRDPPTPVSPSAMLKESHRGTLLRMIQKTKLFSTMACRLVIGDCNLYGVVDVYHLPPSFSSLFPPSGFLLPLSPLSFQLLFPYHLPLSSLVPRPSPAPVFDRLQYAKTEGEGLVNLTT